MKFVDISTFKVIIMNAEDKLVNGAEDDAEKFSKRANTEINEKY